MKILIIKLGAAGDIIRTTAILPELKKRYRNATIDWLTQKSMTVLVSNNPFLDNILFIENTRDLSSYDLVINFDEDRKACELASEVSSPNLIGAYAHHNKIAYTPNSSPWFNMGLASKYGKRTADRLKRENRQTYQALWHSILNLGYKKQRPQLYTNSKEQGSAQKFVKRHKIKNEDFVIAINPGSGNRWWDKRLTITDTVNLVHKIKHFHPESKIILLGGPEEVVRNKKILKKVPCLINGGCKNTIGQFANIIDLCQVLVTSDSLALHIGTALNKKIVAFFAPTSPWEIELYDKGVKILPEKGCVGCYRKKCRIEPKYNLDQIAKSL
jgi:heptosyltransferase-2